MNHVPRRALLVVAATAGIKIAEAVQVNVPNWREPLNQGRFAYRNPNVIDHQITTMKILDFEV
jgi:hypothetical protein